MSLSESCSHTSAAFKFQHWNDHFIHKLVKLRKFYPEKGFRVQNTGMFTGILDAMYDLNGGFNRFSSYVS